MAAARATAAPPSSAGAQPPGGLHVRRMSPDVISVGSVARPRSAAARLSSAARGTLGRLQWAGWAAAAHGSYLLRGDVAERPPGGGRRKAGARLVVHAGIRAVENFDGKFQLQPEPEAALFKLLESETFRKQVALQPGVAGGDVAFTGKLFQPVPWSVNTKHGMLPEYEVYLHDKENYAIVNVPPNYMMVAKIFSPSRLCAIFRVQRPEGGSTHSSEEAPAVQQSVH